VLYVIYAEDIADSLEKRHRYALPIWRVCSYYMMKVVY
jgi:hypothetical protein